MFFRRVICLKREKKAAAAAAIDAVNAVMPGNVPRAGTDEVCRNRKIVVKLSGIFYLGGQRFA